MLTELPVVVGSKPAEPSGGPASSLSRLLTEGEAAELLGVTPQTLCVWRCTRRYSLAWVKVGRLIRYRLKDLEKFIESRRVQPHAVDSRRRGGDALEVR
jgi:excisionase family DNA binding protein